MDVSKDRFPVEAVKIIQDIADSHFIAIDLEFSGVAGRSQRRQAGKPSLQEIYEETKAAAERYQVLQIGLTIVKQDIDKGRYTLHPYNFNISPIPALHERYFKRDWTMNSGAVAFLLKNRFNFGLPLTNGIPYLSRLEVPQVESVLRGDAKVKNPDMELKHEDEVLVKHIRLVMNEWKEQPKSIRESYVNIPLEQRGKGVPGTLNRYQMRLVHQIVQNEFPEMKTSSMHNFVQVIDPNHEESVAQQAQQDKHVQQEISRATGFGWLLEAIVGRDISRMPEDYLLSGLPRDIVPRDGMSAIETFALDLNKRLQARRKVLIGHNCFTDLIYLQRFFEGRLPQTVEGFQSEVHENFPAIVDTKHMASFGTGRWRDTSLAFVEEELQAESVPIIVVPPEFDRYKLNDSQHEAGYDSLLTAKIAVKLSAKLKREESHLQIEGAGKPSTSTSTNFGETESYVTPTQSIVGSHSSDLGSNGGENAESGAVAAPKSGKSPDHAKSPLSSTLTPRAIDPTSDVIAVKERKSSTGAWDQSKEVKRVKTAFTNSTIYDVLDKDTANREAEESGYEADEDLLTFSDTELSVGTSKTKAPHTNVGEAPVTADKEIAEMIKRGQLMPPWEDGQFWSEFGNKLQVNACKEGECRFEW